MAMQNNIKFKNTMNRLIKSLINKTNTYKIPCFFIDNTLNDKEEFDNAEENE